MDWTAAAGEVVKWCTAENVVKMGLMIGLGAACAYWGEKLVHPSSDSSKKKAAPKKMEKLNAPKNQGPN